MRRSCSLVCFLRLKSSSTVRKDNDTNGDNTLKNNKNNDNRSKIRGFQALGGLVSCFRPGPGVSDLPVSLEVPTGTLLPSFRFESRC